MLLISQVGDLCVKKKLKDCHPAWSLKNRLQVIYYLPCHEAKQGCVFVNMAWPIDKWLSIEITQEGDQCHATAAAAKHESKQWKKVVISALVLAKSKSEGSSPL